MRRSLFSITLIVGNIAVSPSLAQDAPSGNPLAGPQVSPLESRSLAAQSMLGMEEQGLQDRPELAALALLGLTEAQSREVDAVLREHAAAVDRVFRANALDIQQWTNALRTGAPREKIDAISSLREAYAPVTDLGRLDERVAAVLPEEAAIRFRAILEDHERELEEQARQKAEASGERFVPFRHRLRRQFAVIGQDLRASYERTLVADSEQFEAFLAGAELSPEGEAKVRAAVRKIGEDTGFNASPEQRRQAFIEAARSLDPADRAKLMRAVSRSR